MVKATQFNQTDKHNSKLSHFQRLCRGDISRAATWRKRTTGDHEATLFEHNSVYRIVLHATQMHLGCLDLHQCS